MIARIVDKVPAVIAQWAGGGPGRYATETVSRAVCICGMAFLLAACPKETSFIEHYADRSAVPDTTCVLKLLQSVATGNSVQQLEDTIALGTNHRFLFESGDVLHHLSVLVHPDNSASLRHTAWAQNHNAKELRRAKRSLIEVEGALSGHCGLAVEMMEESCQGRSCDVVAVIPNG